MRKTRIIAFLWVLWLVLPMPAQEAVETQVMNYAEKYILEAIAANSLTQNKARRAVLFGTASEMYHAMGDEKQSLTYARRA